MNVGVIIPALDEEAAIGNVGAEVPRDVVNQIYVIDNGSKDRTAIVASQAGARVIQEHRRGYGSACLAGLDAAKDCDILVFMDGDSSDDPSQINLVLDPILNGQADLVIASRRGDEAGSAVLPPHQILGNRIASWLIRLLYRVRLCDIGSFRAIRRERLLALGMSHPTYGWPVEMIVKAARRRYRILQVPVTYRRRSGGESKVGGTIKGSLLASYHMVVTILRYTFWAGETSCQPRDCPTS